MTLSAEQATRPYTHPADTAVGVSKNGAGTFVESHSAVQLSARSFNGRSPNSGADQAGNKGPLWTFLRGFIKHPVMVGSVIPSSRILIDKMLQPVDWANTRLFVEYGPGVGTFTQHILDRVPADATVLAIDTNADFTDYLTRKYADQRLVAVTGSAADIRKIMRDRGFDHADFILSGLPFSTLPAGVGPRIAEETANALRPGGAFLVYQFSPKVRDYIAPHFERIDKGFEWVNVPPATLFWAWKD